MQSDELGYCIRAWRDRLDPAAAGLPAGAGGRAPGPRFEEMWKERPVATRGSDRKATTDAEAPARLGEFVLGGVSG